ncbi:hypothetical protein CR513_48947, partial [Mucuna pruriens]
MLTKGRDKDPTNPNGESFLAITIAQGDNFLSSSKLELGVKALAASLETKSRQMATPLGKTLSKSRAWNCGKEPVIALEPIRLAPTTYRKREIGTPDLNRQQKSVQPLSRSRAFLANPPEKSKHIACIKKGKSKREKPNMHLHSMSNHENFQKHGHGNWTFEVRYEVQPAALSLAPTLEKYERLLGIPMARSPPYLFHGHYPSWALVAKLLKTSESEMLKRKRNKNDLDGFPRANIEDKLHQLHKEGDWQTFMDVYRLLIYDIVLFPQVEDYIDLATMDVFLAKKDRGENPVIVVLTNTYYTLNYYYEKNEKALRCCMLLLYLWMMAHLFHSKRRTTCPIEDHHWSWIKPMSRVEWTRCLDEALEKSIRWYLQWNKREDVIIKCGGPRSCEASSSYKASLRSRLEWVSLTCGDPRLDVHEEPDLGPFIQILQEEMGSGPKGTTRRG